MLSASPAADNVSKSPTDEMSHVPGVTDGAKCLLLGEGSIMANMFGNSTNAFLALPWLHGVRPPEKDDITVHLLQ